MQDIRSLDEACRQTFRYDDDFQLQVVLQQHHQHMEKLISKILEQGELSILQSNDLIDFFVERTTNFCHTQKNPREI
ncbi:hypothetical protein [Nitrosomonas supralitoralis]|uniref:hypothetical protein n=1 Tax=Nitrosomonas supralitoralis TaxID=2116706 RepID=UPI001558AAF1|nr:hypothetical protein [Nitrosomonas supralitoralis]